MSNDSHELHHADAHHDPHHDTHLDHHDATDAIHKPAEAKPGCLQGFFGSGILFPRSQPQLYQYKDSWKVVIVNLATLFVLLVALAFFIIWFTYIGNTAKLTALGYVPTEFEYNAPENADMSCLFGKAVPLKDVLSCDNLVSSVYRALNRTGIASGNDITTAAFKRGCRGMLDLTQVTCTQSLFPMFVLHKKNAYASELNRMFMGLYYATGSGSAVALTWMLEQAFVQSTAQAEVTGFMDKFLPRMYSEIAIVLKDAEISYSKYYKQFDAKFCQNYQFDEPVKIVTNIVNSFLSAKGIAIAIIAIFLNAIAK